MHGILQFHDDAEGATAVEYAVMLGLIIGIAVIAVRAFGTTASSLWSSNNTGLDVAWAAAGGS